MKELFFDCRRGEEIGKMLEASSDEQLAFVRKYMTDEQAHEKLDCIFNAMKGCNSNDDLYF